MPKFKETILQPTKPVNAWKSFNKKKFKELKLSHPDQSMIQLKKMVNELWSKLDESEKSQLEAEAEKDKLRY